MGEGRFDDNATRVAPAPVAAHPRGDNIKATITTRRGQVFSTVVRLAPPSKKNRPLSACEAGLDNVYFTTAADQAPRAANRLNFR